MTEFESFNELLKADRSVRRFDGKKVVTEGQLVKLIGLTRFCSSGRNLQPIRYRMVSRPEECEVLFPTLKWAGYLQDWDGPEAGERPTAYLVQCLDTTLTQSLLCDDGLQLQAITLGATAMGLGNCIIKSFNAAAIREALRLPEEMKPLYVLALGYPVERVVIEEMDETGDIKYWRDEQGVHHVPKRKTEDLIIK